jgi:hypothetical protein
VHRQYRRYSRRMCKVGHAADDRPLVMLPNEVRGGYQVDGDARKSCRSSACCRAWRRYHQADPQPIPATFIASSKPRACRAVRGGSKEDLRLVFESRQLCWPRALVVSSTVATSISMRIASCSRRLDVHDPQEQLRR